jgi:iron-sulfur cluster assembly protein
LFIGHAAKDRVLEKKGARIFLDPLSMLHLNSKELDYKDSLMQSGFVFNNPNFKGTCDCGTSFAV